jgi:Na+-translocating ferredoxin:NAD+ oxidoreductase RnfD subunit
VKEITSSLKFIWTDRRYRMTLVLLLVWILAIYNFGLSFAVPTVALAVVAAVTLDFLINRFVRKLTYFPISGLVSGLIIGLLVSPAANLTVTIAAAVLAILSKHIITYRGRYQTAHIFNPAAFGLLTSSVIFATPIAWWGVSWWPQMFLVLIPSAGYIIYKIGRLPLVGTFLATYALTKLITTHDISALISPLDATVIFFALVMLPEPQSSPATGIWKYGFGILVGVFTAATTLWSGFQFDPLITSLLLADLAAFAANLIYPANLQPE